MSALLQDLRFALRTLRRSPGFALVTVLTLALGIGGNTAIFGFLNAVLLRPLPVAEPDRLVWMFASEDFHTSSYPDYLDLREQSRSFSSIAASYDLFVSLSRDGAAERVRAEMVSENFFSTLSLTPTAGRFFTASEGTPGGGQVVVLGHELWQRRFGSQASVIGRTIQVNGHPFTVVGVAPRSFSGTQIGFLTELWIPIAAQPAAAPALSGERPLTTRSFRWLKLIGRLAPGRELAGAQSEISALARRLAAAYPDSNKGYEHPLLVSADGGDPKLRDNQLPMFAVLMGTVGLVLLIVCVNVANLLLARALLRRGEIGVRQALGATRLRLIRQMLVESLLLSGLGGCLGILLTLPVRKLLLAVLPVSLGPLWLDLSLDHRVLLFTLALSLLTGLIFGLAPSVNASGSSLLSGLRGATPAARAGGMSGARSRSLLVILQVALSLMLLVGAGLLVRTLRNQSSADPGFDLDNVLLLSFDLSLRGYEPAAGARFLQQVEERLETLPSVVRVSFARVAPLSLDTHRESLGVEGAEVQPGQRPFNVMTNFVGSGYFETLQVPLLRGRDFDSSDTAGSSGVAIVNEALAEHFWPGEDPIGKRIASPAVPALGIPAGPPMTVVGLTRTTKYLALGEEPRPFLYLPLGQQYQPAVTMLVRSAGDPLELVAPVRRELEVLDPHLPIYDVRTLSQQVSSSLWSVRLVAATAGLFGAFALLLAALGLYGLMAQSVAHRAHEIGIRMAVGAQRSDIFRLVVGQGMRMVLIGTAIGLAGALALGRLLSGFLFGVGPADPMILLLVPLILAAVAWAAAYVPARRALRVDPVITLRFD